MTKFEAIRRMHIKDSIAGYMKLYSDNTEFYIQSDYSWEYSPLSEATVISKAAESSQVVKPKWGKLPGKHLFVRLEKS